MRGSMRYRSLRNAAAKQDRQVRRVGGTRPTAVHGVPRAKDPPSTVVLWGIGWSLTVMHPSYKFATRTYVVMN